MTTAIRPWRAGAECPLPGYAEFKAALSTASYHNAAQGTDEMFMARKATLTAVRIALDHQWPYWVMNRMFKEIIPLVAWDTFMQYYIDQLTADGKSQV